MGRAEGKGRVEGGEQPARHKEGEDDRSHLYYKLFCGKEQGFQDENPVRTLQRGEFHRKFGRFSAEEQGEDDRKERAEDIEQKDGEDGAGEEGRREREKDGQFCTAGQVGKAQNHPLLHRPVVETARGKDGGRGTAEAHQEGEDRPPRQPDFSERAVREHREAGEEPALLEQGEKELQEDDLRQKTEHASRASQNSVREKARRHGRGNALGKGGKGVEGGLNERFQHIPRHPLCEREKECAQEHASIQREGEARQKKGIHAGEPALRGAECALEGRIFHAARTAAQGGHELFPQILILKGEDGNAETGGEFCLIRLALGAQKELLLGENEGAPAPVCGELRHQGDKTREVGIFRDEAERGIGMLRKISGGEFFLERLAAGVVDARQVHHVALHGRTERGGERIHRHAVPVSHPRMPAREAVEEGALARVGVPDEENQIFHTRTPAAISFPTAIFPLPACTTKTRRKGETLSTVILAPA